MNVSFTALARYPAWQFVAYIVVCVYGATAFFAPLASAHQLKNDGAISSVLHLEPDDDALISGKAVTYILFLNDSAKRFSLANCTCTVALKQDNTVISSGALRQNAQHVISGTLMFPTAGSYTVTFSGTPIARGAFQSFNLQYPEEVAADPNAKRPSNTFTLSMAGLVTILLVLAALIKVRYNTLKTPHTTKE